MSFSFGGDDYHGDGAGGGKVDMDDLYETKQRSDLFKLETYNKVLARVHARIKMTGRRCKSDQHCWFVVPEVMLGAPNFDHAECVAYLVSQLEDNGFCVRYTHPNLLFVSWQHWVPGYVRNEIKKKTGVTVNGFGEKVPEKAEADGAARGVARGAAAPIQESNPDALLFQSKGKQDPKLKIFKPTGTYKPTGALKYTDDMLSSLNDKLSLKLNP
jgi:hypothetical protein